MEINKGNPEKHNITLNVELWKILNPHKLAGFDLTSKEQKSKVFQDRIEYFYHDGITKHRTNGPAVEYFDGYAEYWLYGQRVTVGKHGEGTEFLDIKWDNLLNISISEFSVLVYRWLYICPNKETSIEHIFLKKLDTQFEIALASDANNKTTMIFITNEPSNLNVLNNLQEDYKPDKTIVFCIKDITSNNQFNYSHYVLSFIYFQLIEHRDFKFLSNWEKFNCH